MVPSRTVGIYGFIIYFYLSIISAARVKVAKTSP